MNMSMKKAMTMILASCLIVMGLSACGSNSNTNSSKGTTAGTSTNSKETSNVSSAAEPIKLRIMWWGSQGRHDATLKALELYTEQNPHVTFEPEFSGWDGYWDKLATQSAAKNAPDIIQMDPSYLADYSTRNQLADLAGINTNDMDRALLDSGKYQGTQYAIPLGNNAIGLAYNKKAIESLGIALPKANWTWDEYFEFAYEVKSKLDSNQYVLQDFGITFQPYVAYQLSKGKGQVFLEDGSLNLDKDTFIEWQTKHVELREAGIVPPGEVTATDTELDPNADLLANGTILVRTLHGAQSGAVDSFNPGAFDMVTMPRGVEAGGWLKPSMHWSISSDSKYIEESKKFIDWFINDLDAAEILGTTRGIPVSSVVLEKLTPSFSSADIMGKTLVETTAPDAQQYVPEPSGWTSFAQKDYKDVTNKIAFGVITPEQAYDELMKFAADYE